MQSATGTCLDVVKAINYLGVIFTYFKLHIPIAKLFLAFLPHLLCSEKELHVWISHVLLNVHHICSTHKSLES